VSDQLALLADPELCAYGLPKLGQPRLCSRTAPPAARWSIPDGPRASSGEVRCCLDHANYYAQGWLSPALIFPAVLDAVWLEVL